RRRPVEARCAARTLDDSVGRREPFPRSAAPSPSSRSRRNPRTVRPRHVRLPHLHRGLPIMSNHRRIRRIAAALAALACAGTVIAPPSARAGTTGGLGGTVTEAGTSAPIAGVRVTVASPSQSATTLTDASGHFHFVSLAPDEYTASLEKAGYDPISYPGIAVLADAQQTLGFVMHKALKTIAQVSSRSASSLVRPGTTADIYSINAQQQARLSALGGGGSLNSAYSAIASVPGAYVP